MSVKVATKTLTLRLPVDLLPFLEEEAEKQRRTKSNYIEWLLYKEKVQKVVIPDNLPTLKLSDEETARIEQAIDEYKAEKAAGYKHPTFDNVDDLMKHLNSSEDEE